MTASARHRRLRSSSAVTARTIAFKVRSKDAYFYPDSPWRLAFFGGYKFESAPDATIAQRAR